MDTTLNVIALQNFFTIVDEDNDGLIQKGDLANAINNILLQPLKANNQTNQYIQHLENLNANDLYKYDPTSSGINLQMLGIVLNDYFVV